MGKYTVMLIVITLTIILGAVLSTLCVLPHLILTTINHMKDIIITFYRLRNDDLTRLSKSTQSYTILQDTNYRYTIPICYYTYTQQR